MMTSQKNEPSTAAEVGQLLALLFAMGFAWTVGGRLAEWTLHVLFGGAL